MFAFQKNRQDKRNYIIFDGNDYGPLYKIYETKIFVFENC